MRCYERITLTEYSETYCMLERGHKGKHSIHEHTNICHLCKPEQSFPNIVALKQHNIDVHRVFKG